MTLAPSHPAIVKASDALRHAIEDEKVQDMILFAIQHDMSLRVVLKMTPRREVSFGFTLDDDRKGT